MGRDSQWSVVWWTWFRDWRGFQWHGYTVLVKPMQTAHLASCFTFLWFGVIVKENYQQYEWSSLRSMHLTMRFDFHTEICRRSLMATSVQVDVSESPHHTDREGGPICGSFFFHVKSTILSSDQAKMACWLVTEIVSSWVWVILYWHLCCSPANQILCWREMTFSSSMFLSKRPKSPAFCGPIGSFKKGSASLDTWRWLLNLPWCLKSFSYVSLRASQKRSRRGRSSPPPPDAMEPLTAGSAVAKRGAPLLARLMLSISAEWLKTPSGLPLYSGEWSQMFSVSGLYSIQLV